MKKKKNKWKANNTSSDTKIVYWIDRKKNVRKIWANEKNGSTLNVQYGSCRPYIITHVPQKNINKCLSSWLDQHNRMIEHGSNGLNWMSKEEASETLL